MSTATNLNRVTVMGGEGIGVDVTAESRRVLTWFAEHRGMPIRLRDAEYGKDPYLRTGKIIPPETWDAISEADAILFGATGGPETKEVPDEARNRESLLSLRRKLDLFANVRPIYAHPALHEASPLKPRVLKDVDFIIVRELSSGIYFGEPRGIETRPDGTRQAVNTEFYTSEQVRRVARFSFELAAKRKGKLCSVDKANVLESSVMWREEVIKLHQEEFPHLELNHMYVDNASMQVVLAPSQFDVIVTSNIFGDILSDCAAVAAGSLGMLPSASFGPKDEHGKQKAFYEPVHGSAPDIAGKGIANPLGSIQSLPLMFRLSLNRPDDAALLESAIAKVLADGIRTRDIAEPGVTPISTSQMGDAVLERLSALA